MKIRMLIVFISGALAGGTAAVAFHGTPAPEQAPVKPTVRTAAPQDATNRSVQTAPQASNEESAEDRADETISSAADTLDEFDFSALLDEALADGTGNSQIEIASLLALWSHRDPAAGFDWIMAQMDALGAMPLTDDLSAVLLDLLSQDPKTAHWAIFELPHGDLRTGLIDRYITQTAGSDPAGVKLLFDTLDRDDRRRAAGAYVQSLSAQDLDSALGFIKENPDLVPAELAQSVQSTLGPPGFADDGDDPLADASAQGISAGHLNAMGRNLAGTGDLGEIVAQSERLSEHPPHVRSAVVDGMIQGLLETSPESAKQLLEQMPSGKVRDSAVAALISSGGTNDLQGLAALADTIGDSTLRNTTAAQLLELNTRLGQNAPLAREPENDGGAGTAEIEQQLLQTMADGGPSS